MKLTQWIIVLALLVLACGEDYRAMATKPTQDVAWADSAAPADKAFPTAKYTNGYAENDPVPYEDFNGLFATYGEHIDYLTRSAGHFAQPQVAQTGGIVAGDTFVLPRPPIELAGTSFTLMTENAVDVVSDGQFVIALEQGGTDNPKVHVIDPSGTTAGRVWETGFAVSTASAIAANGSLIAVAGNDASGSCHVFDYDGNLQFGFTHGAAVNDIWIDANRVVVVGAAGTNSKEARAYDLATEALDWELGTAWTTGDLWSVVGYQNTIFMAGENDGSGNTVVAVNAATGAQLDRAALTEEVAGSKCLAVGPNRTLWALGLTGAGGPYLDVVSFADTTALALLTDSYNLASGFTGTGLTGAEISITVDPRAAYVPYNSSSTIVIPLTGPREVAAAYELSGTSNARKITTDGRYLYSVGATSTIQRAIEEQPGAQIWSMVDLDDQVHESADYWFYRKFQPGG